MRSSHRTLVLFLASVLPAFAAPGTISRCDANLDGVTNVSDVQVLVREVLGLSSPQHNLNNDTVVTVADAQIVIAAALQLGCPGDSGSPIITDFNPKTGPIGTVVTITGANFGGAPTVTLPALGGGTVAEPVSVSTAQSITFVLGAGSLSGVLSVSNGTGVATSTSPFTVLASNTFGLTVSPPAASVIQGQSISYAVTLSSNSGFVELAALDLTGVPAGIKVDFSPTAITAGQTSVLTLTAPAGQPVVGAANLSVTASATVDGIAVSQSTPLSLSVEAPSTSFIGRTVVSDALETPLANIRVWTLGLDGGGNTTGCLGHTVMSDSAGNFALTNLPASCVGPQLIGFDGDTATSPPGRYAGVNLVFTLIPGKVVVSPVLVHMPRIDNVETFQVQQNSPTDQTHVFKSIPGLQVTVYAGTTFTMADGSQPNPFPLAAIEVPVDRLPDQMPLTNSMVTAFIVAFQPANTTASKAVAVWFPNTLNTPPGTGVPLMTLDPTRGRMVAYGTGVISNDGTTIIPSVDPATGALQHRYGIIHFDWHGPAVAPPTINPPCSCDGQAPRVGKPVDLASGIEVLTATDMFLKGSRGPLEIIRTYRTLSLQPRAFGIGSSFNYDYRLDSVLPQSAALVNLEEPDGVRVPFTLQPDGTLINTTAPAMSGAVMTTAPDGTAKLRFKSGVTYSFTPGSVLTGSVLTAITDPNGNVTKIVRDPTGPQQINDIIDPVGRKLTLTWDSNPFITSITDPIGRKVTYTYNSSNTLATFTDVLGGVTKYTYDSQNRLSTVVDPRGITIATNTYYADGRVQYQNRASGGTYLFQYTLTNALVPTSPVTQTVVTDPRGVVTTYRFNTQGYLVSATDASGQTRVFDRASGTNFVMSMKGTGTCEACGDPRAGDMTFTYDTGGNILTQTDALGNTTSFTYEPEFNNIASTTDPAGNVTKNSYDAHGNVIKTTDPRGFETIYARDGNGLITSMQDAAGNITRYTYDSLGNLTSTTDALNQKTQFAYDGASRLTAQMDPLGRLLTITYNASDELTSIVEGNGETTRFTYNVAGFPASMVDPNGNTSTVEYDGHGRVAAKRDALGRAQTYTYDFNDNVISITNRRGLKATFLYDSLNRMDTENWPDATVKHTYDAAGRMTQVVDSQSGTFKASFDLAGRLIKVSSPNGILSYTRDAVGRIATRQVQGQPVSTYAYDANSNLTSAAMGSVSTTRTYDPRDLMVSNSRSNGVNGSYSFDADGRLTSILEKIGGTTLLSRTFGLDVAGQITKNGVDKGLALATPSASGTFDAANQAGNFGGTTYTSDGDGNRLTESGPGGVTNYTWDARGRLQSIQVPGGVTTSFAYDPEGLMIQKRTVSGGSDTLERYILDASRNIVSITQGNSTTSILDGRSPDDIVAVVQGSTPSFPLADQVRSQSAFTDGSGNIAGSASYEPYGATTRSGTVGMFQFTGRPVGNASVYYNRWRFYDAATGTFLSRDPAGIRGGSANLYQYAGANPISYSDPLGLATQISVAGGGTIIALVYGGNVTGSFGFNFDGWNSGPYFAAQGSHGFGGGVFGGFGISAGISHGSVDSGWSKSEYVEADGGMGVAVGFGVNQCKGKVTGGSLTPLPKIGVGYGVGGFYDNTAKTRTFVGPTIGGVYNGIAGAFHWVGSFF